MSVQVHPEDEVRYPDTDGVPVGETETHYNAIMDLVHQLRVHFRERQDVHVGANQFWYFEEGNPRSVVCPDVYVVFGVPRNPPRDVWKTWEDHTFPSVVFEFTSRSTRTVDTGSKKDLYQRLGVDELWWFDPLGEYLNPRFQGWIRDGDRFVPVRPDADGRCVSDRLVGTLHAEDRGIVLTGRDGVVIPPVDTLYAALEAARREALDQARRAERLAERLRALGVDEE